MQISQNGPLEKFTRFLFVHFNVSCITMYGAIKIMQYKFMRYKFMRLALDSHNSHK